ncbi:MAG: signal peptidase I [Candidatus Aenigmarchaeota archaeon]|nr:signal peptidase I [Candidatus Aenigmarchaeota archaeon]MBU5689086.1 signal peptidase I [Candidatus Aenigmarchaeota archaeon]
MKKSELIENIKFFAIAILLILFMNYGLGFILKTDLPVVAVISESMTHDKTTELVHYSFLEKEYGYSREEIDSWPIKNGFRKGDVLVIKGVDPSEIKVGDVIVFDIEGQKIPIVHRIIKIDNGEITTKGDHNPIEDPWKIERIHGKVVFVIPFLGWPKLVFTYITSWFLSLIF